MDALSVINNNKRKKISFFDKFIKILFSFPYPKSIEERKTMPSHPMTKTTRLELLVEWVQIVKPRLRNKIKDLKKKQCTSFKISFA